MGLVFDISYSRKPFFLRPGEEVVSQFLARAGVPRDATRGEAFPKCFGPDIIPRMNELFAQAGLDAFWGAGFSDTMDSHRLAWYASTVSLEAGERLWRATSRRFFEGKDTQNTNIRLDNHGLLLECAQEAGLDLAEARAVLGSDRFQDEVLSIVHRMQRAGINSIPVLVFEVEGVASGSWLTNDSEVGRTIHHGSGNKAEFCALLLKLHADCASASL